MLDRSPATLKAVPRASATEARLDILCACLAAEAPRADAEGAVTAEAWEAVRRSQILAAPLPASLGGWNLGGADAHAVLMGVLRRLGAADLSMGRLLEGHINAVLLVRRYGTPEQVEALAGAVSEGALSGVWGAEGPTPLEGRRRGQGWDLMGGKILASGAGSVTHPLVPVATAAGPLLMMPVLGTGERADLSGWTAQGMRSTATGAVDLTGLRVPDARVIGAPGDFMRQPAFSGGAWRFCAVHLGAAERLVDLFRDHLVSRGRDRDPYQVQRVAQAATAVATARFWIAEAARKLGEEDDVAEAIVAFANLTRGVTERAALDVLEVVHRGIGLAAFVRPHPAERIARDLGTYLRQPVPDLAMADAGRTVLSSRRPTASLWTSAP